MSGWQDNTSVDSVKSNLQASFARVKRDLEQHKELIQALGQGNARLEKSVSDNNKRLVEWISYFEASLNRLEASVSALESRVDSNFSSQKKHDQQAMAEIKSSMASSLEGAFAVQLSELEAFKAALKQELKVFVEDFKLKTSSQFLAVQSESPISNVNNANNVTSIMPESTFGGQIGLSNSEKWLMGVLFNAEAPLSYAQISERTGKTVSTARVYMNQLKAKGFVEESSLPNGVKIFGLKHEAKVKKLYNL